MFSLTMVLGFLSLAGLLGFATVLLRQLGADDAARVLLAVAAIGLIGGMALVFIG